MKVTKLQDLQNPAELGSHHKSTPKINNLLTQETKTQEDVPCWQNLCPSQPWPYQPVASVSPTSPSPISAHTQKHQPWFITTRESVGDSPKKKLNQSSYLDVDVFLGLFFLAENLAFVAEAASESTSTSWVHRTSHESSTQHRSHSHCSLSHNGGFCFVWLKRDKVKRT